LIKIAVPLFLLAAWLHPLTDAAASMRSAATRLTVREACSSAAHHCSAQLGAVALAPGGAPARTESEVSYQGSSPVAVRLYLRNFEARSLASLRTCTAANPARRFALVIRSGASLLFSGSLAQLASDAADPHSALQVPAPDGRSKWRAGQRALVTTTVGLERAADNTYMGCSSHAELAWLVSQ
jgi:hypothetical protein